MTKKGDKLAKYVLKETLQNTLSHTFRNSNQANVQGLVDVLEFPKVIFHGKLDDI